MQILEIPFYIFVCEGLREREREREREIDVVDYKWDVNEKEKETELEIKSLLIVRKMKPSILSTQILGGVWYMCLNNNFQCLNTETHIFTTLFNPHVFS